MIDEGILDYGHFEIASIELETATARLFKDEKIEWGKIELDYTTKSGVSETGEYWFSVEAIQVDFHNFEYKAMDDKVYTSLEESVRNQVVETKQYELAFFIQGEKLSMRIDDA